MSDDVIVPDEVALRDDLAAAAVALEDAENTHSLRYVAQFLGGIARSADDRNLERETDALAQMQHSGIDVAAQVARLSTMVQDRIARTASI